MGIEICQCVKDGTGVNIQGRRFDYFDTNPHDGILETHNVHESLSSKLKCLIFIPIVSQTYCDSKSFAWQHEFCVFNRQAKEEALGRDIKLRNGNVASRILPVRIHELDPHDLKMLSDELEGPLRSIDFIYREAGCQSSVEVQRGAFNWHTE